MKKIIIYLWLIVFTMSYSNMHHHKSNSKGSSHRNHNIGIEKLLEYELDRSLTKEELRLEYLAVDHHINKAIKRNRTKMNHCMARENDTEKYNVLKIEIDKLNSKKEGLREEFLPLYKSK